MPKTDRGLDLVGVPERAGGAAFRPRRNRRLCQRFIRRRKARRPIIQIACAVLGAG